MLWFWCRLYRFTAVISRDDVILRRDARLCWRLAVVVHVFVFRVFCLSAHSDHWQHDSQCGRHVGLGYYAAKSCGLSSENSTKCDPNILQKWHAQTVSHTMFVRWSSFERNRCRCYSSTPRETEMLSRQCSILRPNFVSFKRYTHILVENSEFLAPPLLIILTSR